MTRDHRKKKGYHLFEILISLEQLNAFELV